MAKAANLGFPRLGPNREWKKACEKYWAGKLEREELFRTAEELKSRHLRLQAEAGIEIIPCNDFAFYDAMLDMTALFGAVPPRFSALNLSAADLDVYFAMARGSQNIPAMEMTKWFDTNYHYIVPEFHRGIKFRLASDQPFQALESAKDSGIHKPRPVLIGPATFLLLGKVVDAGLTHADLLSDLLPVYEQTLNRLAHSGAAWVQLDEPILVTDLSEEARQIFRLSYDYLTKLPARPRIMLTTYFGGLEENTELALNLGAEGLHLDLVRAPLQLDAVLDKAGKGLTLSLGVVDGRNVWRTDLDRASALLKRAADRHDLDRIEVAPSCSLLHSPLDLSAEKSLDPEIKEWLAFGVQKLGEVKTLTRALNEGEAAVAGELAASREAWQRRRSSRRAANPAVRARLERITEGMFKRPASSERRRKTQRLALKLPLLPTTTIGSFPQTDEIRKLRADLKKGLITAQQLQDALRAEMRRTLKFQEAVGLDVLVHGEFERNDMVEYFGEQMEGFVFTQNAWVQSFGSRAVKPPIIYGDVARPRPMTIDWLSFAQSQTSRPVKGMLTGPVTMLEWSFVRDDQPRKDTCLQLALAIRDEVADLEQAGIKVIQIDEPALPEGLPLRRRDWETYLNWAVRSFRLASSGVKEETQIHTHMCYCEFDEILEAIAELDMDVISFEGSRSRMEILDAFSRRKSSGKSFNFSGDVGPGIYDIHSPRVPSQNEIADLLRRALQIIPAERLWVNPDCGLKTRVWPEIIPALKNMILATRALRQNLDKSAKVA